MMDPWEDPRLQLPPAVAQLAEATSPALTPVTPECVANAGAQMWNLERGLAQGASRAGRAGTAATASRQASAA